MNLTATKHSDQPYRQKLKLDIWLSISPLVLAASLACLLIPTLFGNKKVDFEDAALIPEARSIFASIDGTPIHSSGLSDEVLEASHRRGLSEPNPLTQATTCG